MRLLGRRVVVYGHRWLGITGSILFVVWFASGIVMMYARMPRLAPEERLMRSPVLDLSQARVAPGDAASRLEKPAERLRVGMFAGHPVYRFHDGTHWIAIRADTGERLTGLDTGEAADIARAFAPDHAHTVRQVRRIVDPDQWTLQIRALLPAHVIAIGDAAGTELYVSEQTGEPVLETTSRGRVWGYLGAVLHWIYFTPIRRHSAAWVRLIIWISLAGCVLCLSGLVWGVWRYSPSSRYRLRGVPHTQTPYAGMMRWHHYAGLVFGLVTFTWIFSGLLSMDPWDWSPGTTPTRAQRDAVAGGPLGLETLTLDQLQAAASALSRAFPVKEIELLRFDGELMAEAYRAPEVGQLAPALGDPGAVLAARLPLEHVLIAVSAPEGGAIPRFDLERLTEAARRAMPGIGIADAAWLDRYDAYYYDRHGALPLPVARVRFTDPAETWLYLDSERGAIVRREERLSRVNRWLYHGLHSLDFPGLYERRPLWDVVVIALSVGGIAVSVTSAPAAFRRLRRHARLFVRRWR